MQYLVEAASSGDITVDGRSPAPPGMYKTHLNPMNTGIPTTSTG